MTKQHQHRNLTKKMNSLLVLPPPIMDNTQVTARLGLGRQIVRFLRNLQVLLQARHSVLSATQRLVRGGQCRVSLPLRSHIGTVQ